RTSALPILFKAFGRLPGEDNHAKPAPGDALRVASHRELPPRMRTIGPSGAMSGAPRIAYPPPDARIELGARETVALDALGGTGRLRWLVDGRPLEGTTWTPDGAGIARLAVVDEAGRSSSVTVRIQRR
ncbi:MAG: penicillin-binding protein 1C, partial [Reyranella sp.]|nr:penicillin-binding protein 1C [Reyranella sp.]